VDVQEYIEQHKNDPGFKKVHFGLRCGPFIPGKDAVSPHVACDTGPEAQEGGAGYVKPALGGFLGATEATREVAVENFLLSPLETALAVFLISVLMFRNVIVPTLLTILLAITLFAQYGLGGYFTSIENWSGNLAFHTQVVLSISMGLGIDYGIYIVSRLREEMAATGGDWIKSLEATLCSTGSAVLVSVVVLLGSFIPLLATELANTWSLGIYIGQALIIDVITALTILPMLVWLTKPKYVFQKG
jgi:predicted RND superfamily exporter protein